MLTRFITRRGAKFARNFATYSNRANPPKSQSFMDMEAQFGCHNYKPLPVVITRGEGMFLWDVEGKQYYDFLAAYSAVNQGHVHPKILKTLKAQAKKLVLTSRAFYNDQLGPTEKFLSELFGYEKTLMMNGGVEACESAIKLARRWAYTKKGVPDNQAKVLFAKGNFWGRTIAACGSSDDPDRFYRFGPFGGLGFEMVEYDDINAIEEKFKSDPNFAAVMLEPIQGEAGVIIPKPGYLRKVRELCTKYNVLFIADEVQTGLGRCGKMLAVEWDGVKPDILCLGKALSGGFLPISATLANDNVMMNIKPGEHGSTYGGNPLAAAVAKKAVEVILDEKLVDNSLKMGHRLQENLKSFKRDWIKDIRGRGLFIAVELQENEKKTAWDLCMKLMEAGILAKPTHGTKIRFSPPLIIDDKQIADCSAIIKKVFDNF